MTARTTTNYSNYSWNRFISMYAIPLVYHIQYDMLLHSIITDAEYCYIELNVKYFDFPPDRVQQHAKPKEII